jgi:hypothetical protein
MARPVKNNADYFSHDNDMRDDERIKAVRRKFSHIGYSTWNMLLERLCRAEDFKIEYTEDSRDIMAGDFSIEPELLKEIIDYLIKLKLIIQEGKLIYSQTMITRFEGLFRKRKRDSDRLSPTITTDERIIADDNAQSKVKKTIEKEIKEKGEVENQPPIFSKDFSGEENIYSNCIEPCRLIFLSCSPQYAWGDRDSEQLMQLLQKIKQTKKSIQTGQNLIESFSGFLQKLPDYWRTKKFTIPHLNNNYNEIVSEIGASQANTQVKNQVTIKIPVPQQAETKREATPEEKLQSRKSFIQSICESYEKFAATGQYGYLPLWVMYETLIQEQVLKISVKKLESYRQQAIAKRKEELQKPKNAHETRLFQGILGNFNEEMKKENESKRIENEVKTLAVQELFTQLKEKQTDIKTLFKN